MFAKVFISGRLKCTDVKLDEPFGGISYLILRNGRPAGAIESASRFDGAWRQQKISESYQFDYSNSSKLKNL